MLYSLDQDDGYAKATQASLSRHGLEEFVSVRHAPLRKVRIRDKDWLWYEIEKLGDVESVDMVIVDGPPGNIQRLARYPALPLLADRLSERAVIVLDDCFRHAEKEILQKWLADFPAFTSETVGTEKGTVILRKSEGVPLLSPPIQIPFLDFAVTRIQD
jgi:predicted O-methyltransferase YrrM